MTGFHFGQEAACEAAHNLVSAATEALGLASGAAQIGAIGGGTVQDALDSLGTVSTQDATNLEVTVSTMRRPGFYNFRSSSFLRWSAALSKHRAGTAKAAIACIGDSTMRGVGSNPASATDDLLEAAWPTVMASALSQMPNTKATADSVWCDGFFGTGIEAADPRFVINGGWIIHASMFCAGGHVFHDPNTSTLSPEMTFDPAVDTDTLDLYVVKYPGYADVVVSTNATFNASGSTNAAAGVGKISATRSADKGMPWVIQKGAGTASQDLLIVGMDAYTAADKPISIWNMGASGSRASHWVADNQPYSFINALPAFAPDLSIVCLTINDWANDTAEATYKSQMQSIIDACLETGDVLLVVGVPSNTGTAPVDRQQEFAGFVRDLADTNDLPVLDLSERWVSQSLLPSRGLYYDGLHPSNVGYADIGHMVAQVVGNPGYFLG